MRSGAAAVGSLALALLWSACSSASAPKHISLPASPAPSASTAVRTVPSAARPPGPSAPHPPGPCGTRPPGSVRYTHVVWIWMENHSYDAVVGSASAPYLNRLIPACGVATNYHNISNPSLPNYIAATSGLGEQAVQAFAADCDPSPSCQTPAPSIFDQGETWKAYEDAMPVPCDRASGGEYAARHNPAVYYTSVAGCSSRDVPYIELRADLGAGRLPAFSFVTPDLIHDMHDGSVAEGDNWLAANLPPILDSAAYRQGTVAVFLTWDEGEGGAARDCTTATATADVGCHVATVVISPTTRPGTASAVFFDHWSLLRTTEELLGLPRLGSAAAAPSMRAAFGL